ncbi:MAG: fumarylacetoacetate hydrolase family protein [Candidatus Bathyarchaeota archaeon]|nr:MAG: fumarylacetoacetate hydrolase family protein [Candidatus Bathyarchaeota archaeon]
MKIVIFGAKRLGALLEDGSIVDLNLARATYNTGKGVPQPYEKADAEVPTKLLAFIEEGGEGLRAAGEAISLVKNGAKEGPKGERLVFKPDEVKIHAPLPSLATRLAMAGANFFDHSAGMYTMMTGNTVTREELVKQHGEGQSAVWGFWKHARNVIGPGDSVIYPASTDRLDYEVEVGAVIGRKGKDIPENEAMGYVYGYTCVLDMSKRSQIPPPPAGRRRSNDGLFLSKNFDTSVPMGPCLVTAEEVGDPHRLRMGLKINGEVRQDGSHEDMIRGYPFWINHVSRDMTLYPGDIICGGTCAGTAADTSPRGADRKPSPELFLKPGDSIEAWVEKIGTLNISVVAKG